MQFLSYFNKRSELIFVKKYILGLIYTKGKKFEEKREVYQDEGNPLFA